MNVVNFGGGTFRHAFEIKGFSINPVSSSEESDFGGRSNSMAIFIHPPQKASGHLNSN